jgi:hypothetical protein
MGGSSEMAMRERGDATRVQIPPARQRAAWRPWRVCSDAAGWPAPTWHLCHVTPRLSSSLTGLEITSAPCEWGELRTNYGPRRSNSAHINGQPWTPAINGSRSTTLAARSGGQGVASSNLASPTVKDLGGGDLLDCMKAPKTLNGHRFRTFRTLRFRTRGRLMKNCRCPVVYASCGTSRSCSRTSCTSARGRPDPPDRARAGPARLAGTCPRFAAGPAPLTPKTYCFASSRTLIRD